jgi:hypothetical protein
MFDQFDQQFITFGIEVLLENMSPELIVLMAEIEWWASVLGALDNYNDARVLASIFTDLWMKTKTNFPPFLTAAVMSAERK